MILHLGEDVAVSASSVIAILDVAAHGQDLSLFGAQVVRVGGGAAKSAVLTVREGARTLYYSCISAATLAKRLNASIPF